MHSETTCVIWLCLYCSNWVVWRSAEGVNGAHKWLCEIGKGGTYDPGEDLLQLLGGACGLGLPAVQAVLKVEQRLAHRVRERHARRVDERDRAHAPALREARGERDGRTARHSERDVP